VLAIARAAARLDAWMQAKLGRPYNLVLAGGLVIEIAHRVRETIEKVGGARHLAGEIALLLLEAALLIHQVGELSHHFETAPSDDK
jgi:hypothetical protein